MSYHFSMGAINKSTYNYEYPKIANKINKYMCPCCEKDVIFRNGKIKQPHFAHYKSDNPCYYYDKPSETQVHKDAKLLMKSLLDNKRNIHIQRPCNYCEQRPFLPYSEEIYYDIDDDYTEDTKAVIEHKFYYNNSNRSADVALIENDTIKYIFEICYKNKTKEENRPEPWIEINAEDLINKINSGEIIDEEGNITIKCERNYKCEKCNAYEIEQEQYYEMLKQKKEQERIIKWNEAINQREEAEIRIKEENIRKKEYYDLQQLCICGIAKINLCICENPHYELNRLSNNLFCKNCNNWKCRCK